MYCVGSSEKFFLASQLWWPVCGRSVRHWPAKLPSASNGNRRPTGVLIRSTAKRLRYVFVRLRTRPTRSPFRRIGVVTHPAND
jgi:hypothetical protein